MKKILFLGAAKFQLPPILYALGENYYVITCDNRPENIGHKFAHKSYNISTLDKEEIFEIAQKEKIDGILSFGSDISMPSVAYVAHRMKLPGNDEAAVDTLVSKAKFREFLNKSKIQHLDYKAFALYERANAVNYLTQLSLPQIIKPIDSSGSKGVSIVRDFDNLGEKIDNAYKESISKTIIIEKYISKIGKQICGDGFVENGQLKFVYFGDGQFYDDEKYLAPWGETFPSSHNRTVLNNAKEKINEIISTVGFQRGPVNLDLFAVNDNEVFVNEIGPRSGGNYIPTATYYNTNINMIAGSVECAIHEDYKLPLDYKNSQEYYSCYMIHSKGESGIFERICPSNNIKPHIFEFNQYVDPGAEVHPFLKGSDALANVILKFKDYGQMQKIYEKIHNEFIIEMI